MSLSEEGPGVHNPKDEALVPGELLLDPELPVANMDVREFPR